MSRLVARPTPTMAHNACSPATLLLSTDWCGAAPPWLRAQLRPAPVKVCQDRSLTGRTWFRSRRDFWNTSDGLLCRRSKVAGDWNKLLQAAGVLIHFVPAHPVLRRPMLRHRPLLCGTRIPKQHAPCPQKGTLDRCVSRPTHNVRFRQTQMPFKGS